MDNWDPVGPDMESVFSAFEDPLLALSEAETPAIMLRQVYEADQCVGLVDRFIERDLMRDPKGPTPEGAKARIDIGSSLGQRGKDKEAFLEHSRETHTLFEHLFDGFVNPVDLIYNSLSRLAGKKKVRVAEEPDGRQYGPAIFRIHYTSHKYVPHIDHVTLREKRFNFEVTRFEHQFAGILCIQNSSYDGENAPAILHECLWTPEIQPHIANGSFHEYATDNKIRNCQVALNQGDLYFFNTRCIH